MPKGYLNSRSANLQRFARVAKQKYLETMDWYATAAFMRQYMTAQTGLSRTTIADYLVTIEARIRTDPEVRAAMPRQKGVNEF